MGQVRRRRKRKKQQSSPIIEALSSPLGLAALGGLGVGLATYFNNRSKGHQGAMQHAARAALGQTVKHGRDHIADLLPEPLWFPVEGLIDTFSGAPMAQRASHKADAEAPSAGATSEGPSIRDAEFTIIEEDEDHE